LKDDISVTERLSNGLCVKECPTDANLIDETWWKNSCTPATSQTDGLIIQDCKNNAKITYGSVQFLYSPYCSPDSDEVKDFIDEALMNGSAGAAWSDIETGTKTIIICCFTALVFSILFMWMMSKCARGLAMFSILLLFLSFFGGAGACFYL